MSLRHALLGALADRPRTGYALLKHFEQSLAYAWPASHSQIYPELARLVEDGLIELAETGARGSKTYAITDEGVEEVRRWLRETEPERRVRSEAQLRAFFVWLLEPEEAREFFERERAYWRGLLAELREIEKEPAGARRKERAFRLSLEGGIRLVTNRIDWLDWAIDEVSAEAWEEADARTGAVPAPELGAQGT
jgi:PadR family transcriptional regulator, regulatory protein AphA